MQPLSYDPSSAPRLGVTELAVSDMENSLAFYEGILGFQANQETTGAYSLSADGTTPLIRLTEDKGATPRPPATTGLFHIALLLPSRQDLACLLQYLATENIPLQGASDHLYSEAVYMADPDGNGIEIYADRPPALWKKDPNGQYVTDTLRLDIPNLFSELDEKPWSGMPVGTTTGHIHLQVGELGESEAFYTGILGLDVATRYPGALFLSKDGYHHHIAVNVWNGVHLPTPPDNSLGLQFLTLLLHEPEWAEVKRKLQEAKIVYSTADGAIHVTDPSGVSVRILPKDEG